MACFTVPVAEAIIVTAVKKSIEKKENNEKHIKLNAEGCTAEATSSIEFSKKLGWLSKLLWGGSLLLAFEHLWHGELTLWFPFLTALSSPADTAEMLYEMATAGVAMAVIVTAVWVCMLAVSHVIEKRTVAEQTEKSAE